MFIVAKCVEWLEGIRECLEVVFAWTRMGEAKATIFLEGWNCILRCLEPLLLLRSFMPRKMYYIKDGHQQLVEFEDPMDVLYSSHAGVLAAGKSLLKRFILCHGYQAIVAEIERYRTKSIDSWKPSREIALV